MAVTAKPRNTLSIKYKKVNTAYIAKKEPKDVETTETLDYSFGSDGNNTSTVAGKKKIAGIIFDKETKNGHLNDTKRSTLEKVQSVLTKNEYNKGDVIKIPLLKEKVTFEKIDSASIGDEVFIVIETENLQGKEIKINLKQANADGIEKLHDAMTVQQDGTDLRLITATVGDFGCDSTTIENKDDFKDWAIAKIILAPKDDTKNKEYKASITDCENKITNLYLAIDAESGDNNWFEVLYDEVFDATPNVWLKEEVKQFGLKVDNLWHEPILNPQRLLYNSSGNYSPRSGSFGYVRKVYKDGKLVKKAHAGIDIFAPVGETVYACMKGEVISAKLRGSLTKGYGNTIIIKVEKTELDKCKNDYKLEFLADGEKDKGTSFGDSDDRYFLYAHLKSMTVKAGDKVNAGDVIGISGKSGNASSIKSASNRHLHFEILDKNDTSDYYQMKNRGNAAFYVNFITADKEKQKNNKD